MYIIITERVNSNMVENLKNSVSKILESNELTEEFKRSKTLEEVHEKCKKSGYNGDYEEFKKDYEKIVSDLNSEKYENVSEDKLTLVSGGAMNKKITKATAAMLSTLTLSTTVAPYSNAANIGNCGQNWSNSVVQFAKNNKGKLIGGTSGTIGIIATSLLMYCILKDKQKQQTPEQGNNNGSNDEQSLQNTPRETVTPPPINTNNGNKRFKVVKCEVELRTGENYNEFLELLNKEESGLRFLDKNSRKLELSCDESGKHFKEKPCTIEFNMNSWETHNLEFEDGIYINNKPSYKCKWLINKKNFTVVELDKNDVVNKIMSPEEFTTYYLYGGKVNEIDGKKEENDISKTTTEITDSIKNFLGREVGRIYLVKGENENDFIKKLKGLSISNKNGEKFDLEFRGSQCYIHGKLSDDFTVNPIEESNWEKYTYYEKDKVKKCDWLIDRKNGIVVRTYRGGINAIMSFKYFAYEDGNIYSFDDIRKTEKMYDSNNAEKSVSEITKSVRNSVGLLGEYFYSSEEKSEFEKKLNETNFPIFDENNEQLKLKFDSFNEKIFVEEGKVGQIKFNNENNEWNEILGSSANTKIFMNKNNEMVVRLFNNEITIISSQRFSNGIAYITQHPDIILK